LLIILIFYIIDSLYTRITEGIFCSKIISMVFSTKDYVIFRLWLCHPGFAVLIYGFTPASLPETKPNIVNNPG
jgi:hypothetical protein